MRRTTRVKLNCVMCAAIVLVGAACQADGDDGAGDAEPIEEPTSVTESTPEPTSPSSPTEPTDDTPPSTSTASPPTTPAPTPTTEASNDTSSTLPDDVLATTPPAKTTPATQGGATETVYPVGSIDSGLAPFVTLASVDLATRLDVGPDTIEVLTAVLVVWPSAALGCPEPDRAYAQVVTDGSVIELGAGDRVYRYHSGGARSPFPCDRPLDPVPTPAG